MPRMPKRLKFRKQMRGVMRGNATRGNYVAFGEFGLQSLDTHWVSARQIESARIACQHFLKRQGQIFIRIFPDKPISKKPLETRMGKGKGSPEMWVAPVKPGRIIYELEGVPVEVAQEAMRLAGHKMPVKTKFVLRREVL